MTLARECQAVFRRNVRLLIPHIKTGGTLRIDETNLPPDLATFGGSLLSFYMLAHYPVVKIYNWLLPSR